MFVSLFLISMISSGTSGNLYDTWSITRTGGIVSA
jgi:hypothetical protein